MLSRSEESGFSLLEVVISMAIFTVIALAAAGLLLTNLKSATGNRARVVAADLALRDVETVRAQFVSAALGPSSVQEGLVTNPQPDGSSGGPTVVNGRAYTTTRESVWEPLNDTLGPCDGGNSRPLAFLRVTVRVTWPDMGSAAPISNSTQLTPPLGTYKGSTGHVKVKVLDATNTPESNTLVTLTTPAGATVDSQTTASDGCVFFAFVNPGSYIVTVSRPGYVSPDWNTAPTFPVTVVANAVASVPVSYTPQATLQIGYDTSVPGYLPSPASGFTLFSPNLATSSPFIGWTNTASYAATVRSLNVWPGTYGVGAWAGDCFDSDPGQTGSRANPYPVAAGTTTVTAMKGALVTVHVTRRGSGFSAANINVEAVHGLLQAGGQPACPSGAVGVSDPDDASAGAVGEVLPFVARTDPAGNATILLPYGTWTFKTQAVTRSPWPQVVIPATTGPVLVPIVIE